MSLSISHWSRLYGESLGSATLKQELQDFVVEEQLGFEPTGTGEHIFLWLEKSNLNTAFVAEALAKFSKLPLRDITYAGRKDKFALTRQWFGVHIANKQEPDWSEFSLEGASILNVTRNDRKLRVGVLKGNKFSITLRDLHNVDVNALKQRLQLIQQKGAANYYGSQRFGEIRVSANQMYSAQEKPLAQQSSSAYLDRLAIEEPSANEKPSAYEEPPANKEPSELPNSRKTRQGGNLALAEKLMHGEAIRNRNKRSLAISALRSWLFNEMIHERIEQRCFHHPLLGDAMQLSGSNSFFVFDDDKERDKILTRLAEFDVNITAPLWGDGKLHTAHAAKELELSCANERLDVIRTLNTLGLKQERRAIRIVPSEFSWQLKDNNLSMEFSLPAGCFATSIVRELFDV